MSEFENWSQTPDYQTQHNPGLSLPRNPLSRPAGRPGDGAPHHRNSSDVSLVSQHQLDDANALHRQVSAESQRWLPMQGGGISSLPTDRMEGVDLGSPEAMSPYGPTVVSPQQSQFNQRPPTSYQSRPAGLSFANRPKPTPMQFEDNTRYYSPPGGSYRSTFSPRERFQKDRQATGDSQTYLLNTPISGWTQTPRTPPAYAIGLPQRKQWWKWRPAWIMYVFLLFGFCCALGHHLFYAALDGRIADNQLAMLRYGTVLSFAAKAGFVAAVITAYRQRIWVTVRNKLLSVGALDSLFAATDDVSALWNVEIYQKAKLAMGLASLVWLTPLVIILTSNTLLVESVENVIDTHCPGVRTLNFTHEELEDFRNPTKIDGLFGLSVNFWNKTTDTIEDEGWYDYYTGPTDVFRSTASLGIFSHQVASAKNAALEICGSGWNCSYMVDFVAPGYKCSDQAIGVDSVVQNLGDSKPPFGTDFLMPRGKHSYYVHATKGDYATAQLKEVNPGGLPLTGPPFPKHLGAFRTEPVIWGGYVERTNPDDKDPPNNNTMAGWNESYIPKVFACEHYETSYSVKFNFEGKDQSTNVLRKEFLWPVQNTTFQPDIEANDGTNDNTTATPAGGYVYPYPMTNFTNTKRYRRLSTFHSIGSILRDVINGTLDSSSVQTPVAVTKALQTKLLNPRQEWFAYPNLKDNIQGLYEDIILSMFSNHLLLSLTWAAKPWETTGDTLGDSSTLWPCTKTRWENRYKYVARDLWIVYSCACLCAVVAVVLGTAAVLENEGRLYDTRFSSIVAATRGPALEKVMWKEDKGDLASSVRKMKVGYGLIHRVNALDAVPSETRYEGHGASEDVVTPRFGFGLEGDVRQIRSPTSLFRGRT